MYSNNLFCRAIALALVAAWVTACGGGSSPSPAPIPTAANEVSVTVDAGPANSGTNVNRLYTAVKICQPGTAQCQTIDHVLVDTGSSGLRLLASVITPGLNLRQTGTTDRPLLNCAQFLDDTAAWGPVVSADVVLGGKTAASVPIQVIGVPEFDRLATIPTSSGSVPCSGSAMHTVQDLGANGILGLGLLKEDCGEECGTNPHRGFYYTCTDANCTAPKGALASRDQQVKNPVPLFASDNNGVLIDLPKVGSPGASVLNGLLIFGIGTQKNNQLVPGVPGGVLTTDSLGYFTTWLPGPILATNSLFDSGSNGLFFDSAALLPCRANSGAGFYCPSTTTDLWATLVGVGVNPSRILIPFSIENATTLFTDASRTALPGLAGPINDASTFDWGLPFFYGRRVFFGIEGQAATLGTSTVTGPYYAF